MCLILPDGKRALWIKHEAPDPLGLKGHVLMAQGPTVIVVVMLASRAACSIHTWRLDYLTCITIVLYAE